MNCSFIITVSGSVNFIWDFDKVQLYYRYNRGKKKRQLKIRTEKIFAILMEYKKISYYCHIYQFIAGVKHFMSVLPFQYNKIYKGQQFWV